MNKSKTNTLKQITQLVDELNIKEEVEKLTGLDCIVVYGFPKFVVFDKIKSMRTIRKIIKSFPPIETKHIVIWGSYKYEIDTPFSIKTDFNQYDNHWTIEYKSKDFDVWIQFDKKILFKIPYGKSVHYHGGYSTFTDEGFINTVIEKILK